MRAEKPELRHRSKRLVATALIWAMCLPLAVPASADEYRLAVNTKIQVTIVQWNPSKGEYQRWDALGGTFVVSPEGTVGLPVIGSLHVSELTSADAAARIATTLREKAGLLAAPEVTVEIAEYPPIYVVGAVTTPGAYPFRPGLTVLQGLAIAGGRYRAPVGAAGQNETSLRGELVTVRADELRFVARIARLEAELAGDDDIHFPPELTEDPDTKLVGEVIALERMLFAARANEAKRQLTTLSELRDLYTSEIQMLNDQGKASSQEIALTEQEVAGLTKLVEQGVTTVSRWSELRRVLAQLKAAHGQDDIATMRARQSLSDTTRQEFGIRDKRQTEVATQLSDSKAELARLRLREKTLRQLLSAGNGSVEPGNASGGSSGLKFAVVRQDQAETTELPAFESTPLLPGDVLKVYAETALPGDSTADDSANSTDSSDLQALTAGVRTPNLASAQSADRLEK